MSLPAVRGVDCSAEGRGSDASWRWQSIAAKTLLTRRAKRKLGDDADLSLLAACWPSTLACGGRFNPGTCTFEKFLEEESEFEYFLFFYTKAQFLLCLCVYVCMTECGLPSGHTSEGYCPSLSPLIVYTHMNKRTCVHTIMLKERHFPSRLTWPFPKLLPT